MLEKTEKYFIEIGSYQHNKFGNTVCGDCVLLRKSLKENRNIAVLSDGLGSGIKANVLSTMTASMALNFRIRREPIIRTVSAIMDTLPIDSNRNISYSTFTIVDIDLNGEANIVEYDNPPILLIRNGKASNIESREIEITNHFNNNKNNIVKLSDIQLKKEDRLIFYSDGVSQSGIGNMTMPFGWEEGVYDFVEKILNSYPTISARELSLKIVKQSEINDILKPQDDTSCVVFYIREPRKLLICTGPPFLETKDKYLSEIVKSYKGKKIICGGTTSQIIARELKREIKIDINNIQANLPPSSKMEGIDLVTEGIITLSSLSELLEKGIPKEIYGNGPAWDMFKLILDADVIEIIVGTKINIAHQDPSLLVELEIRRNVIKRITFLLEEKFMKEVITQYI